MAIVERCFMVQRLLAVVAVLGLLLGVAALGQIKLSPGRVPIGDNELNSSTPEPLVTIDELSTNAVMRPTPSWSSNRKIRLSSLSMKHVKLSGDVCFQQQNIHRGRLCTVCLRCEKNFSSDMMGSL